MAIDPGRLGQRLEAFAQIVEGSRVDQEHAGAQRRQVLPGAAQRAVGGKRVIGFDRVLGLDLGQFGRGAEARQHGIARRRFGHDLGEGGLRLGVLALLAHGHGVLECRAGGGRFLCDPIFIAAPAADAGHDQHGEGDDVEAVFVPQLLQPFAPDFFVNFTENIGHEWLPAPFDLIPEGRIVRVT